MSLSIVGCVVNGLKPQHLTSDHNFVRKNAQYTSDHRFAECEKRQLGE